jgi:hypothetical protein
VLPGGALLPDAGGHGRPRGGRTVHAHPRQLDRQCHGPPAHVRGSSRSYACLTTPLVPDCLDALMDMADPFIFSQQSPGAQSLRGGERVDRSRRAGEIRLPGARGHRQRQKGFWRAAIGKKMALIEKETSNGRVGLKDVQLIDPLVDYLYIARVGK